LDYTGKKIGHLTVTRLIRGSTKPEFVPRQYECVCDCGKKIIIRSRALLRGKKSCGCESVRRVRTKHIIGKKIGMLTVIRMHPVKGKQHRTMYFCHCDCGGEKLIRYDQLNAGIIKSCGCLRGPNKVNWVGLRVGYLKVMKRIRNSEISIKIRRDRVFLCQCYCGREREFTSVRLAASVKRGYELSCGCMSYINDKTIKRRLSKIHNIDGNLFPADIVEAKRDALLINRSIKNIRNEGKKWISKN
jgi:hypothetical protein